MNPIPQWVGRLRRPGRATLPERLRRAIRLIRVLLLFVLAAATIVPPPAMAQSVQRQSLGGYGLMLRRYYNAAEEQGRTDWPQLRRGEPGTQVLISFDPRNADVTLVTNKSYGLSRLLAEARGIAIAAGYPRADFFTLDGTSTAGVDIELNKYLRIHLLRTDFGLDLEKLSRAIQRSSLRRPVETAVDPRSATNVLLDGGRLTRPLSDIQFISPSELRAAKQLHFTFQLSLPGLIGAALLLGLMGITLLAVPWKMARMARRKESEQPDTVADPLEVQRKYDKGPPVRLAAMLVVLVPGSLLMLFDPGQLLQGVMLLLPVRIELLSVGIIVVMAGSIFVERLSRRRRPAPLPGDETGARTNQTGASLWRGSPVLMAMAVVPLLLMIVIEVPVYSREGLLWRRDIVFAIIGLSVVVIPWIAHVSMRSRRTILTSGQWYEMVMETAQSAGARVRTVALAKSTGCNASASLFGTVLLTQGLVDKLDPDEIRAVIAHEVGHLKAGHVPRAVALSLVVLALVDAVWYIAVGSVEGRLPLHVRVVLWSPIPFLLILSPVMSAIVGPSRRRAEREADRFAVEVTGDPELVVRALVRLHTLNATPHRLKRADELLADHPSLVHRIELIRAMVP